MADRPLRVKEPHGSALTELRRCVERGASGEFICASSSVEVHVFLQRGRVAWAVEASRPLSFVKALRERCGISEDELRHAFEEGRRERRPLGETLARWNLAAWDDIRWALEQQLVAALAVLAFDERGTSMFLERARFGEYDDRLTFGLDDLVAKIPMSAAPTATTGTFRKPDRFSPASERPSGAPEAPPALSASEVLVAVRGAVHVEVLRKSQSIDVAGAAIDSRERWLRVMGALEDGASLVAAHSAGNAFVGAHIAGSDDRVWLMLGTAVTLGAALIPLASKIPSTEGDPQRAAQLAHSSAQWVFGDVAFDECEPLFSHDEVLAAFVADHRGVMVGGRGRASLDLHEAVALTERRCKQFVSAATLALGESVPTIAPIGYRVATREGAYWCLGAAMGGSRSRRSVWVLTDPSAGLAIGWACLAALARATAQASVVMPRP